MTRNNLIVKPILWALLLLNNGVIQLMAQEKWVRLDNIHKIKIEDLVMSKSGAIYAAVYGRNILLESVDYGQSWNSIILDTFKYYASNMHKRLLIDHQDSLIEFFFWSGIPGARKVNGQSYNYINPTESVQIGTSETDIKYDDSGICYYYYTNELYQYTKIFSQKELIFKTPDYIANYFMYTDSLNYIITNNGSNSKYSIYKLNTKTREFIQLDTLQVANSAYSIIITRKGTILCPTRTGLYISDDDASSFKRVVYDILKVPYANIRKLYLTQQGNLVMQADESFYFSNDDGNKWIQIRAFGNHFPIDNRIKNITISDTTFATMQVIDSCENMFIYILTPQSLQWEELDIQFSNLDYGQVTKSNLSRLFAKENTCNSAFIYSDDDSKSWQPYLINNSPTDAIIKSKTGVFFCLDKSHNKLFRSLDHTETWKEFDAMHFDSKAKSFTELYNFNVDSWGVKTDRSLFFTKDNGDTWQNIPNKNFPIIRNLINDQNGKLLSYNFFLNKVYSSSDYGQSWDVDDRFKDFNNVIHIIPNKFGGFLISGIYKGVNNVYLSYDLINFIPVNGNQFKPQYTTLFDLNEKMVAGFVYGEGIFLSRDGGMNWEDFTDGLDIFRTDICYLNSLFSDSENHVYASIQYDGLYKTVKPLVSDNVSVLSNEISIFPNPFNEYLIVKSNLDHRSSIELFDAQGRLILKEDLKQNYHTIKLNPDLPKGIYVYKLISDNKSLSVGKLFKG